MRISRGPIPYPCTGIISSFLHTLRTREDMKDEELDWQVYHLLLENADRKEEVLAALLGCTPGEVGSSLTRLERAMLLDCTPEGIRVLSLQEVILRCQARYDHHCPFFFEGGVIRTKSGSEEKDA